MPRWWGHFQCVRRHFCLVAVVGSLGGVSLFADFNVQNKDGARPKATRTVGGGARRRAIGEFFEKETEETWQAVQCPIRPQAKIRFCGVVC